MKKIIFFLVWLTGPGIIYAQSPQPFETTRIGVTVSRNVNHDLFHQYWHVPNRYGADVRLPFYVGHVFAGACQIGFTAREDSISDVTNTYIFAGWGYAVPLSSRLNLSANMAIGNNFMIFKDEPRDAFKYESEFAIQAGSELALDLRAGFEFNLNADYFYLLTHHRIRLTFISAGLGYQFQTPNFIVEFLK